MKSLTNIFYAFALVFVLAACEQGAGAGTSVGYVSVEEIYRDSKVGKDLSKQLDSQNKKLNKKLEPERRRLEREGKSLGRQRSTLSDAALRSKERGLQEKVARYQQKRREINERLQAGVQESQEEITDVLKQIYEEVRGEKGIDLIINGALVLDGADGIDVTKDVVEILDERLPKVTLEVPKE